MVFKGLRKANPKFDDLKSEISKMKKNAEESNPQITEGKNEVMKAEMMGEREKKLEKLEQLKKSGEMRERAIFTLFKKANVLEKKTNRKLREMDAAQTLKMEQVHAKIREKNAEEHPAMATFSDQLAQLKKDSEAMALALEEKKERDIQALRAQLEQEVAHLKAQTKSVAEQLAKSDEELQSLKAQLTQ